MPTIKKPAKAAKVTVASLCADLDTARKARDAYRAKNATVFDRDTELADVATAIEAKIKKLLAADYVGKASGEYNVFDGTAVAVRVTAKNSREYNLEAMRRAHPEWFTLYPQLVKPAVGESVDKEALDRLLGDDSVPIDKAEVEKFRLPSTPLTPAVSFKKPAAAADKAE